MVTPDQVITDNERLIGKVPIAYNSRMNARNTSGRARAPIESRDGIKYYFTPIGETVGTQQTSTTGASDITYGLNTWRAQSFDPSTTGHLTRLDINLKKNTSFDVSVVEIREDNSGEPGETILATSAAQNGDLPDTGADYVTFRFPNAPYLENGTDYWIVLRTQEKFFSTETFYVTKTTSTSGTLMSGAATYPTNSFTPTVVWSADTGSINFKTYISTAGRVKWAERREDTDGTKETLFVQGTTLYKVNDNDGTTTSLLTGLNSSATYYRSYQTNNITYIANGFDNLIKYDGSTATYVVLGFKPDNVIGHKNRLFFTRKDDPNRVDFSNLFPDIETIDSVNFFYVPDPKNKDPITGWGLLQDQLVIFTYESKHMLAGNDLASFTLREATGTKGAVSQEAMAVDYNQIYFLGDDKRIYAFNGSVDYYISEPIQPELDYNTDPAETYLVLWERQLRVYYKYAGSPYHDRMALYYLVYKEWFIDTETYTCCPVNFNKDSGNPLVEFSSVVGTGYYAEQTPGAHLGAPIDWKYHTTYYKFESGLSKDRIKKFRPYFESPDIHTTVSVGKDVDYKNSPNTRDHLLKPDGARYDTGELYDNDVLYATPKIIDKAVPMPGRGKLTQFRFEKKGAYTKVRLVGFGFIRTSARAR